MYRIVHNEQTDIYRIEKRGLLGWSFVTDPSDGDYLGFPRYEDACRWLEKQSSSSNPANRRWKIIPTCGN